MGNFGKRGGEGATAGRKAETICAEFMGQRFSKRVFFGQRYLVVAQSAPDDIPTVSAWHSEEAALRHSGRLSAICPVAMVFAAEVC